jgi:hypothetical protein
VINHMKRPNGWRPALMILRGPVQPYEPRSAWLFSTRNRRIKSCSLARGVGRFLLTTLLFLKIKTLCQTNFSGETTSSDIPALIPTSFNVRLSSTNLPDPAPVIMRACLNMFFDFLSFKTHVVP